MRRAARVDDNQPQLVKELRQLGATVEPTHTMGKGFPDLVVGFRGVNYLLEVKDPAKSPSRRQLNEDQQKWHARWNGQAAVIETIDDFLAIGIG